MTKSLPKSASPPFSLPANEAGRLEALRRYNILDTPPEAAFDRITSLAARLFEVPIALVSLIDESRCWLKSVYGFDIQEVQQDATLCMALLSNQILVIPDTRQDNRLACNPFVQNEPGLRFYAGAPLLTHDGFNLGTLCLLDTKPRDALSDEQQAALSDLAAMVIDELELRLAARKVAEIDAALLEATQGVSATTGAAFPVLVQHLTKTLGVDYTSIGLVSRDNPQLVQEQAARLEAEADQRQSSFLVEVSTALAASLDYEQTLQSVARLAVPYFADWCSVDLLNDDNTISRVAVAHSEPEKVELGWELARRFPKHLDDGYGISEVMKTGCSKIIITITDKQLMTVANSEYLEILRGVGLKSCIVAPLQARERVLGTISFVFAESDRHYSPADLALAEDLARRAAIAIDNARLYQTAQQAKQAAETAANRTARLQTVTAALSESLTPVQVAEVIVEQSVAALEADAAMMALLNKTGTVLEIVRAVGYEPHPQDVQKQFPVTASFPLADAVRTGEPVWSEPLAERLARYPHLAETYSRFSFQAWISLPLMVEGRAVGGLSLSFKQFKRLSQDDREFMLALTRQCAQAIFRAQLYEAERQARAEAEQANRVKDEFLAVLSHELRTPLNPILGWSKLLQTQKPNPAVLSRGLETIERNAKLQTQLIEDLLDVSRILRGKLSLDVAPVDLTLTIEAAMETVRLAAEAKAIQIQIECGPHVGYAAGDAARLQQVVWNLLSNAVKFTPQGGEVKVRLERIDGEVEIWKTQGIEPNSSIHAHTHSPIPSYIQITVTDNGQGITPEFLPYIFDRFRQADSKTTRKFGGLGLGLAIVRQLVELHGGTVHVESSGEGQGATFIVKLPAMMAESRETQDEDESNLAPADLHVLPLQNVRILVVDDEIDARELLVFVLEQAGALVKPVASAKEALQALTHSEIDVLISDIGMPEMDGYMLMERVISRFAELTGHLANYTRPKAIALTAYAGEMNQEKALAAGFQRHLSKPVEPAKLIATIVDLIE